MMLVRMVVAVFVGAVVSVSGAFAEPEVFSDAGFTADQAAAAENDKLHVIYFTASWCPPCKKMKTTTWVDESVVGWLEENAVVTAVDVDEESMIAAEYDISAMPTIVVLNEGEEIARTVGYQGPVGFRDWLVRAEAGELPQVTQDSLDDVYNEAFEAARKTGRNIRGVLDRLEQAQNAYYEGPESYEKATELYLGLISEMMETGLMDLWDNDDHGLRAWGLAYDYAPAKAEFVALRDKAEAELREGHVDWDTLSGWAVLNEIMGDEDRTLLWLERRVATGEAIPSTHVIYDLALEAAIDVSRFDLLKGVADPVRESLEIDAQFDYDRSYFMSFDYPEDMNENDIEMLREGIVLSRRFGLARQHAIALGINDPESAIAIQKRLFSKDDTPEARMELWEIARAMGVHRSEEPE